MAKLNEFLSATGLRITGFVTGARAVATENGGDISRLWPKPTEDGANAFGPGGLPKLEPSSGSSGSLAPPPSGSLGGGLVTTYHATPAPEAVLAQPGGNAPVS